MSTPVPTYPTYCVAIRTLGTAGEKYRRTLETCAAQTVPPERILVYIPRGYALPAETIGREEYIRCDKGMVTQRSLPFGEITTDCILFLDDDLDIPADMAERLFDAMERHGAQLASPAIFDNEKGSLRQKLKWAVLMQTLPHRDSRFAYKIRRSGHYSYNNAPASASLLSQSCSGACIMITRKAYDAIHFADERWLDSMPYALGEDQMFAYKAYRYGLRPCVVYDTGIIHLDAGSGTRRNSERNHLVSEMVRSVIWYRSVYSAAPSAASKARALLSFGLAKAFDLAMAVPYSLAKRSLFPIRNIFRGARDAARFISSPDFRRLPSFMEYCDKK